MEPACSLHTLQIYRWRNKLLPAGLLWWLLVTMSWLIGHLTNCRVFIGCLLCLHWDDETRWRAVLKGSHLGCLMSQDFTCCLISDSFFFFFFSSSPHHTWVSSQFPLLTPQASPAKCNLSLRYMMRISEPFIKRETAWGKLRSATVQSDCRIKEPQNKRALAQLRTKQSGSFMPPLLPIIIV